MSEAITQVKDLMSKKITNKELDFWRDILTLVFIKKLSPEEYVALRETQTNMTLIKKAITLLDTMYEQPRTAELVLTNMKMTGAVKNEIRKFLMAKTL